MQIGPYTIKQSNASRHYQSSLKVIRQGCVIAHVKADHGMLFNYVRRYWHSPERQELIRQLKLANVQESDIEMILKVDAK
jgi:hypothetical protein